MAEHIEREAAVALIEERQKELCPVGRYSRHEVYETDREKFDAWQEIIDALNGIPTVDAVVGTRCKDCRNHRELNRKDRLESGYAEGILWCMNRSDGVWADGFCSDGEPKEV